MDLLETIGRLRELEAFATPAKDLCEDLEGGFYVCAGDPLKDETPLVATFFSMEDLALYTEMRAQLSKILAAAECHAHLLAIAQAQPALTINPDDYVRCAACGQITGKRSTSV